MCSGKWVHKGDVGEDTTAFTLSMAGSIDAQTKGYITTVTLRDGRKMMVPCAIAGFGAGFAVGEQELTEEAKDPYPGEKVKVVIAEGRINSYESQAFFFVFNGRTCSNKKFVRYNTINTYRR